MKTNNSITAAPLTPEEINRFQLMMVNAKPTVLLLLLFRLDRPCQIKEAAAIVGVNRDTASDYFFYLSTHGYAAKTRDGYILTGDGRQMILPETIMLEGPDPESCGKIPHASLQITDPCGKFPHASLKTEDSIYKDSKEEVLDSMRKISARFTTREILEATVKAFARPVFTAGLDMDRIDPQTALGWIAQAADSPKVRSPWSLVYRRLADPKQPQPDQKYLQDPEQYLPEPYQVALGIMIDATIVDNAGASDAGLGPIPAALSAGQSDGEGDQLPGKVTPEDPHAKDGETDPESPAGSGSAGGGDAGPAIFGRWTPDQAWEMAKETLKANMSRASFQTYLERTWVDNYDWISRIFTIRVGFTYGRDWLESRVTKTAERILAGICNQEVTIKWEV
jgi:hypothetical protein